MLEALRRYWANGIFRVALALVAVLGAGWVYRNWPSAPLTYEELLVRNNKWADERAARDREAANRDMQQRQQRVMEENREKERLAKEIILDTLARESVGQRTR